MDLNQNLILSRTLFISTWFKLYTFSDYLRSKYFILASFIVNISSTHTVVGSVSGKFI